MKKSFDPTKIKSAEAAKKRASNGGKAVKKAAAFRELKKEPAPVLAWSANKESAK